MDSEDNEQDEPKKPKPLVAGNNAAVILQARQLAEDMKGKTRMDAKIWNLADEHFSQIVDWMLSGFPAKAIEKLCQSELQLPPAKVPGRQAQSIFWHEFRPYWLSARRRSNRQTVQAIADEMESSPLNVDAVLRDEIKQQAWELLQHPNPPEKLVKAFLTAVLKLRDQDDREKDRQFAREKFDAAQRSEIEAGLEALKGEIKGNPAAIEAWAALKKTLLQAA